MEIKLYSKDDALDYVKGMQNAFKDLPKELDLMGAMEQELKEMVAKAGTKALVKWGAKAGLKQAAGSSVPLIGNVLMGIWSVVDAALTIGEVNEIRRVATESLEQLDVLRSKVGDLKSVASEFENFSQLSADEQLQKAQEIGANGQDMLATMDECTRARKCMLTPYGADGATQRGREHSQNKGCCKGQTGHHLIYGAMMKGACPGYDGQMHKDAPTVCVEGTNQNVGSHGRVHDKMDKAVALLAKNGKLDNGTMSMDQAIDSATKSHGEAFPLSRCSEKCIRAQLDNFYKDKCANARPNAVDKHGTDVADGGGFGG